jgi:hypothetical protein
MNFMADSQDKSENAPKREPHEKRDRPSERMFRRSQAAERRRRRAERADTNFMRLVFGIAGITTLIVFVIVYMISAGINIIPFE